MKIFITYDFLTTQRFIGKRGLANFDFLVEILAKLGVQVTLDTDVKRLFPIEQFYANHGKVYSEKMLNYIEPDRYCDKSKQLIFDYIASNDLLIGFELSEVTRGYFDQIGVKYLDVWVSPIRFCKDLLFSCYSNVFHIQELIGKYQESNEAFKLEANLLAGYCQNFSSSNLQIEAESALIIGQLFVDKACQKGDEFLSLIDFKAQVIELSYSYRYLYLLKHPLMSAGDFSLVIDALADVDNLVYLEQQNVYELLSNKNIKAVVALSSSVLKEAEFFNKEVVYLYRPTLGSEHKHIYQAFFNAKFWTEILDLNHRKDNWVYYHCDNYLRKKFNAYYAYGKFVSHMFAPSHLQRIESAYDAVVAVGRKLQSLNADSNYVLYGFGTVGRLVLPLIRDRISAIIDKSLSEQNLTKYDNIPVISIAELKQGDQVIIASFKYQHEILIGLQQQNADLDVICLYE